LFRWERMAQKVEIQVTANTQQAETSVKRLGQRFEKTTPEVKSLGNSVGGLTKTLGLLGLSSIGVGVAMRTIIQGAAASAKAQAQLSVISGRLPSELKASFDETAPHFGEIADRFGVLEDDVAIAFAQILESTRQPNRGFEDLAGVIGTFRDGTVNSIEDASALWIAAWKGDEKAIESLTGFFEGLDEAIARHAEEGEKAVQISDKIGRHMDEMKRRTGEAFDQLTRGDWAGFFERDAQKVHRAAELASRALQKLRDLGGALGFIDRAPTRVSTPFDANLDTDPHGTPAGPAIRRGGRPFMGPIVAGGSGSGGMMGFGSGLSGGGGTFGGGFFGPRGGPVFLQHGGVVREPTAAIIGEGGPEAVVPLDRAGGIGGTTVIIQGDAIVDDDIRMGKLADEIDRRIDLRRRRGL